MTSLTLLNENTFDDIYATTVHTDNIEVNDASEISVNDVMNFTVLPTLQGTGIQQYIRESLTVTGALSYSTNQGLLRGITVDNYNRDVILSLSGTTVLSADLTSGTGQSLVLYMNYSQTVGSNKALAITPTNTSQTILSTSIPGNTTSLIATFEILQTTLNQTFVPSGIFDINLFTAEDNPNDGLEVYAELYTVSSLGVETLFATTDQIEVVDEYPDYGETTLSAVNVEQEALEIGGAFRMKIYGVNNRGSAHTLYTYYEGTGAGYSHLHTPFNVALAGGYWSENGTTVYLTNTGNNVAIGKLSATQRLEVSGNILTNDIYGLNASFTNGFYNNLSGLSISGTDIKCDTATFTNGNILGLTSSNLNANRLLVSLSSTFNGAFTVATSASFNSGISVGQSSTFMGEVLVGSGNSTSLFVGGRTTLGNNGLRLHTPLGANINTFVDTKQPAGGSLIFRLDDTLGATERMRLSQTGLSVGTSNMSQRLVVNGNVLVNTNQPITTASSQGMYMTWSRSSPINPVQGGSFGSRGISFLLNQRGSGPGGICLGEVGTDNSVTFNAFLDPSGSLFLAGALIASGGRSQVFDLNVSGGASFTNIDTLNITGTNARLLNMSGTNIEYTTATFNDMYVASATFGNISGLNATFTNLALNALSISNLSLLGLSANTIDASFIYATFIQSFTFNGYNLTITGRDYTDTGGAVQGRFQAGYMPEGNYVSLAGVRGSAFPGVDGTSTISFYSKNGIPTSDAYFSTRLTSQGGDPVAGIADGRFTIRSGSLQFQNNAGIRMLTMTGGFSTSFNTNLNISGALSLSGPLVVSSNATFLSGLVVNGSATLNTMTTLSLTGTNGSITTISGTNIEYTTATFNAINIAGQYARLGLTLNASAPMAYSITFNRFSMSQVDDVGTDGYLSSAQYDALATSAIIWTEDGPNKNIYPQSNDRNLLLYNTDVSGSPTVVDTGVNWRRTTLSGDLNHFLRIRTGGAKDGYLIHQTQNSAPFQLCAGSVQPALLLGGTFNDLIDANTAFQIRTFQNNTPTLMKLQMSGVAGSSNYSEIQLQDPTNNMSFRTAGNSENLLIRDNTRSINRIQITPSTLSHAGTIATLASSGNNRLDIGNAGNSGQFIDFNVGVANDFDARIICGLGTTGTNGAGNVDLWGNRFQFIMPNGASSRTQVDSNGNVGINFSPASGVALSISGNTRLIGGALQFDNTGYTISRNAQSIIHSVSGAQRIIITGNATNPSASPGVGSVSLNTTFTWETMTQYTGGVIAGHNSFTGAESLSLINQYKLTTTGGKAVGIGFNALNVDDTVTRYGSIRTYPRINTSNSSMSFMTLSNGSLLDSLTISSNREVYVYPTIVLKNSSIAVANSVNGKISFRGTLQTASAENETSYIQSVAITGSTSNINSVITVNVNGGSGTVETCRFRGDRDTIFGYANNCSVFLSGKTSDGENGARWHWEGNNVYFDGKRTTTAPDFYFRSNTTDGNTNRFQILGAGGTTCFGAMGQTVVAAIGATITYWSAGNVLGIFASDRRSKNSIEAIDDRELNELWETMRPVKYFFNIDANNPTNPDTGAKRKYYGFVANDLDSRIQIENRNVKIQMCHKCQMRCFHDSECDCEEYNDLECECLQEWTTNIRNYNERDMIAILTAKVKQQERTISHLQEELVKERIQYKTMEDRQNKRIGKLEQTLSTLINKLQLQGMRTS